MTQTTLGYLSKILREDQKVAISFDRSFGHIQKASLVRGDRLLAAFVYQRVCDNLVSLLREIGLTVAA